MIWWQKRIDIEAGRFTDRLEVNHAINSNFLLAPHSKHRLKALAHVGSSCRHDETLIRISFADDFRTNMNFTPAQIREPCGGGWRHGRTRRTRMADMLLLIRQGSQD